MKKLSTLKVGAALRRKTKLTALTRNETRWSSIFKMVERMIEIQPYMTFSESEYINLLLSPGEFARVQDLFTVLKDFQSVTLELQKENVTLLNVRVLFDAIISKYPSMKHYLSPDSHIVHSPCFENAIVKSLNGSELSSEEMESIHSLQSDNPVEVTGGNESVADMSFAQLALYRNDKNKEMKKDMYGFSHIQPTSNISERLFRCANNVYSDNRKRMDPVHLEETLFLRYNKNFWNMKTVHDVTKN